MLTFQLKKISFIIMMILLTLASCKDDPKPVKMEGPRLKIYPASRSLDTFLVALKNMTEEELTRMTGVPFTNTAADSLRLYLWQRSWATSSRQERLYYLEQRGANYSGKLITFWVERFNKDDSMQVHIVDVKSKEFNGSLLSQKFRSGEIMELEDQDTISGYQSGINDADKVTVSFTTPSRSKQYSYTGLSVNAHEFKQPRQLLEFLAFLEQEFDVTALEKE